MDGPVTYKTTYKTALITGASSGIGRELALWFARRGVQVFAAARRAEALESLRAEAPSGSLTPVVVDIGSAEATMEAIRDVDRRCGGLDLVVANAGMLVAGAPEQLEWEPVEALLRVNVTGTVATLLAAARVMKPRGRGHLVGISSAAAFRGMPGLAVYAASKAFLGVFLESLRVDLAASGVRVTCIHPGFVRTAMLGPTPPALPFLMEPAEAARQIAEAIVRAPAVRILPWQVRWVSRVNRLLPAWAFDRLAARHR